MIGHCVTYSGPSAHGFRIWRIPCLIIPLVRCQFKLPTWQHNVGKSIQGCIAKGIIDWAYTSDTTRLIVQWGNKDTGSRCRGVPRSRVPTTPCYKRRNWLMSFISSSVYSSWSRMLPVDGGIVTTTVEDFNNKTVSVPNLQCRPRKLPVNRDYVVGTAQPIHCSFFYLFHHPQKKKTRMRTLT